MERKTPTDAVAKGKFFYLMKHKSVCGMKQPDGKYVQFLYMDGRIANAAKITGNITDENELKLLTTAEGFKSFIKGIGINAENAPDSKGKPETAVFCLQFYGKQDPYVSGTTIRKEIHLSGAEEYIDLSEVEWSGDDNVVGQIRFEFDTPDVLADVTVKLYTYPEFEVPEALPDRIVDTTSPDFKAMIARSVTNYGNTERIAKALRDAKDGKQVAVAFIGGSITQGAGAVPINEKCYAYLTYLKFCDLAGVKPFTNVSYIKAGIGGTPSELGILRYDRDVRENGEVEPDIVVIEFAVNDADDETKGVCYESLVRHILKGKNSPAVILEFAVFADDWNLEDRLSPVGLRYDLPMSSAKCAVTPEFTRKDQENALIRRNEYFYDQFHPTNIGHVIMAGGIRKILEKAAASLESGAEPEIKADPVGSASPAIGCDFDDVFLIDRNTIPSDVKVEEGDFTGTDKVLQAVERDFDLTLTPQFTDNYMHTSGTRPFTIELDCKALFLIFKDGSSPKMGIADVFDNGALKISCDPHKVGWVHCNPMIVFNDRETAHHKVEIRMHKGDEDKEFTILGFGVAR